MYLLRHQYPEFLAESEKAAELSHDEVLQGTNAAAKAGFHNGGERGLLLGLYKSQKNSYEQGKLPGTFVAKTCVYLGKKEEALQLLGEDYENHRAPFLMIRESLDLLTLKHVER